MCNSRENGLHCDGKAISTFYMTRQQRGELSHDEIARMMTAESLHDGQKPHGDFCRVDDGPIVCRLAEEWLWSRAALMVPLENAYQQITQRLQGLGFGHLFKTKLAVARRYKKVLARDLPPVPNDLEVHADFDIPERLTLTINGEEQFYHTNGTIINDGEHGRLLKCFQRIYFVIFKRLIDFAFIYGNTAQDDRKHTWSLRQTIL
jgi:hypothetical protein